MDMTFGFSRGVWDNVRHQIAVQDALDETYRARHLLHSRLNDEAEHLGFQRPEFWAYRAGYLGNPDEHCETPREREAFEAGQRVARWELSR